MVDDILIKPFFDCEGGHIAGMAAHFGQALNTALFFMHHSFTDMFKQVVRTICLQTVYRIPSQVFEISYY